DWTIAHVHVGTLGWNGFLTFGIFYWLFPKIYGTKLYSVRLANMHFWLGTLGILFYCIPMYWAGFTQSLMWAEFTPDGFLKYKNFLETVTQIIPMYVLRALGGLFYFGSLFIMAYNLIKTAKSGTLIANEEAEAPPRSAQVIHKGGHWHRWIERRPIQLLVLSTIVILIGGVAEIFPTILIDSNIPRITSVNPYTPLELEGRDLYIREGCVGCHSQMIRPFRHEVLRYDPENLQYSKAGEFVYDRPFLWGSKRTGPDLHRLGGKYNHSWHFRHMYDPESTSPGSIMPAYPWMIRNDLDTSHTAAKIRTLRKLGVPYQSREIENAEKDLRTQAMEIADQLREEQPELKIENLDKKEIIALIAYLQRLGVDISNGKAAEKLSSSR
ncbi:MAG: cytochrome-c oxidase, cbb3-type subunit II, partial [Bacteroidota bacterium]